MAIAFVQSKSWNGTDGGSGIASASLTLTAGNLIVIWGTNDSRAHAVTFTDAQGNTYTGIASVTFNTTASSAKLWGFYAKNITGGAGAITIHATNGDALSAAMMEFSGCDTTAPLDDIGTHASGTGTALDTGAPPTTAQANEVIVAAGVQTGGGQTFTAGSGFTMPEQLLGSPYLGIERKIVAATGAYNGLITSTDTPAWDIAVIAFKQASAGVTLSPGIQPAFGSFGNLSIHPTRD